MRDYVKGQFIRDALDTITMHPENFRVFDECVDERNRLIDYYKDVLPERAICEARGLIYMCKTPEHLKKMFFYWIIGCHGYSTVEQYQRILARIREDKENAEWAKWFEEAHERKENR